MDVTGFWLCGIWMSALAESPFKISATCLSPSWGFCLVRTTQTQKKKSENFINISLGHEDSKTISSQGNNSSPGNEIRVTGNENEEEWPNKFSDSFDMLSGNISLKLFQEMDSLMNDMQTQINRAVCSAINNGVIPKIEYRKLFAFGNNNFGTDTPTCRQDLSDQRDSNKSIKKGLQICFRY